MSDKLSISVFSKMKDLEHKQLVKLEEKYEKSGSNMKIAQMKANNQMRLKGDDAMSTKKLVDKAFKFEFIAFKASDDLRDFISNMKKKYS